MIFRYETARRTKDQDHLGDGEMGLERSVGPAVKTQIKEVVMCIICVELEKERMTIFEAYRALGEFARNDQDDWVTDESLDEREHRKKVMGDLFQKIAQAEKAAKDA